MRIENSTTDRLEARRSISIFRNGCFAARGRQALAGLLAVTMLPAGLGTAWAQNNGGPPPPPPDYDNQGQNPPQGQYPNQGPGPGQNQGQYPDQGQSPGPGPDQGPPPSSYQALGPEQLDQLVAPIALYPDSLVAQVLAASTYPAQVASAQQFIQQGGNYPPDQLAEQANTQPWDPSVKSLVAFPQVVNDMNRNMDWTTQLGNAYYNQPQDVMSAVQTMRQRAYSAGSLRPTSQLGVTYEPGNIIIAPVSPSVVYVPYYNPWVVYGAPIPAYRGYYYGPPRGIAFGAGLALGFGVGIAIGAFAHFSWGYHNWSPDWHSHAVIFNRNTYISRSGSVVNHGYYGHFDRAPQARAYNQAQAARFGGNHTTINNVTVNRGGNTINRGGQTYNRGGNTINRGGQTYNRGGNTFNRSNTYNNGGNTLNRGGQTYNRGEQTPNSAYHGNTQTGQFNRGSQPQAAARPQAQSARPAPQQHSAPQQSNRGGGGHENHGGGSHDDHHH